MPVEGAIKAMAGRFGSSTCFMRPLFAAATAAKDWA